jgi:undecaprenyl-diphosphatase
VTIAIKTLILAALSGIANCLPLSGDAHMILFKEMAGLQSLEPGFDTAIYAGCVFAILVYFAKDVLKILQEATIFLRYPFLSNKQNLFCDYPHALIFSLWLLTLLAAWMFSFILKSFSDLAGHSFAVIGMASVVLGVLIIRGRSSETGQRTIYEMNHQDSFVMGLAQGVASIPGISRVAAPILMGIQLGLQPMDAAKFSFLLAIPLFMAQGAGHLKSALGLLEHQPVLFAGAFFISLAFGYFALRLGMRFIRSGKFFWFGIYSFCFGVVMLFLSVPRILHFWGF